jgi:hypothetical protein
MGDPRVRDDLSRWISISAVHLLAQAIYNSQYFFVFECFVDTSYFLSYDCSFFCFFVFFVFFCFFYIYGLGQVGKGIACGHHLQ